MDINYYWSGDKAARRRYAIDHTNSVEMKWRNEIDQSIKDTKLYDDNSKFQKPANIENIAMILAAQGSVDAIFDHADQHTAVLNFASYKNPGGMFINGSRAQEECLCAESYLYNVLRQHMDYYEWNEQHKNRALYLNRALYSPHIVFEHNGKSMPCDVITCAAPNIMPSRKYGWGITDAENSQALSDRIEFVLKVAADNNVDTLILGAFGCGVFGQDATEVCKLFLQHLKTYHCFKKVVFAVPEDMHSLNYYKFNDVLNKEVAN